MTSDLKLPLPEPLHSIGKKWIMRAQADPRPISLYYALSMALSESFMTVATQDIRQKWLDYAMETCDVNDIAYAFWSALHEASLQAAEAQAQADLRLIGNTVARIEGVGAAMQPEPVQGDQLASLKEENFRLRIAVKHAIKRLNSSEDNSNLADVLNGMLQDVKPGTVSSMESTGCAGACGSCGCGNGGEGGGKADDAFAPLTPEMLAQIQLAIAQVQSAQQRYLKGDPLAGNIKLAQALSNLEAVQSDALWTGSVCAFCADSGIVTDAGGKVWPCPQQCPPKPATAQRFPSQMEVERRVVDAVLEKASAELGQCFVFTQEAILDPNHPKNVTIKAIGECQKALLAMRGRLKVAG